MFENGQMVYYQPIGWGKIDTPPEWENTNIRVDFGEAGWEFFTKDGRLSAEYPRSIFFQEIPIPEEALQPPAKYVVLKRGDVILSDEKIFIVRTDSPEEKSWVDVQDQEHFFSLDGAYSFNLLTKNDIEKILGNIL